MSIHCPLKLQILQVRVRILWCLLEFFAIFDSVFIFSVYYICNAPMLSFWYSEVWGWSTSKPSVWLADSRITYILFVASRTTVSCSIVQVHTSYLSVLETLTLLILQFPPKDLWLTQTYQIPLLAAKDYFLAGRRISRRILATSIIRDVRKWSFSPSQIFKKWLQLLCKHTLRSCNTSKFPLTASQYRFGLSFRVLWAWRVPRVAVIDDISHIQSVFPIRRQVLLPGGFSSR